MNPIRHQLEREALGISDIKAVVKAFPSSPQVYCSPISGEADLTDETMIGGFDHIGSGFLMPKDNGIITDLGFIAQNNITGDGSLETLRYNIVTLKGDPSAPAGMAVDQNLASGTSSLANNYNGIVSVTGLNLTVPSQFMVFFRATFASGTNILCQLMKSAGPIPGVIGAISSGFLRSTVAYSPELTDFGNPPRVLQPDEKIRASNFAGGSIYIKWKGE